MAESAAARKARLAKKAEAEAAPVEADAPRPVDYPPRDVAVERPEIVAPEPEPEAVVAVEPEVSGLFFVTDLASYGPARVGVDGKPMRIEKGMLYPFQDTAEVGRLLSKGVIRMATDADKRKVRIAEGPGAPLTSASMAGIGIKRQ